MRTPITIKIPKSQLSTEVEAGVTIKDLFSDIMSFEGTLPVYDENTGKSSYTFPYIKQKMIKQDLFFTLAQMPDAEITGLAMSVC